MGCCGALTVCPSRREVLPVVIVCVPAPVVASHVPEEVGPVARTGTLDAVFLVVAVQDAVAVVVRSRVL